MTEKSLRTTARLYRSRTGSDATAKKLSRTWFFRLSGLAFIVMATPALNVFVRGLVGFLPMIMVAVVAGLLEGSFKQVLRCIRKGVSENRLLVLCSVWYLIGVVLNALFRGNGLDDWQFMIGPVISLLGICFAFAFMRGDDSYRLFQIGFLLAMGVQTTFSIPQLASSVAIARQMFHETQGTWIYGNVSDFALLAVLFPMFVWRSFTESGMVRVILLACCLSIFIAVFLSSLATPLLLIVLCSPVIMVLSMLRPPRTGGRLGSLFVVVVTLTAMFLIYQFANQNPLLEPVRDRIENFAADPVSGGYDAQTASTASRVYLAEISIESFKTEPLWGMGGGNTRYSQYVGGHSSLADTLGSYGLLGGGGALLGVVLAMLAKATIRYWKERNWETLLGLTTVVLLVIGGIVDPFWEGWLPMYVLIMARPFSLATGQERLSQLETPTSLSKEHQHRSILGSRPESY